MAKNITISLSTAFDSSGIKSAIYSMSEMQKVTKNMQKHLRGRSLNGLRPRQRLKPLSIL